MDNLNLVDGGMWYFVLVYSIVLHEAAHAWAALKLGDPTAYEGGQVTLDPTPHIKRSPIGMIVVPIISWIAYGGSWMLGWASAPYNPQWARAYPHRAAWMALAGPASNFLLALVAAIILKVGLQMGIFQPGIPLVGASSGLASFFAVLLSITFIMNVVLCIFNLIPLPPLDGSALPLFFMNRAMAERYQDFVAQPTMQFVGLIVVYNFGGRFVGRVLNVAAGWILN